jgi:hypothetical protein
MQGSTSTGTNAFAAMGRSYETSQALAEKMAQPIGTLTTLSADNDLADSRIRNAQHPHL